MDEDRPGVLGNAQSYMESQNDRMSGLIMDQASQADLAIQQRRTYTINGIVNLGNVILDNAHKAQATRDKSLLDQSILAFNKLSETFEMVRGQANKPDDIQKIEAIKAGAAKCRKPWRSTSPLAACWRA
jgi:hypothetical protein